MLPPQTPLPTTLLKRHHHPEVTAEETKAKPGEEKRTVAAGTTPVPPTASVAAPVLHLADPPRGARTKVTRVISCVG